MIKINMTYDCLVLQKPLINAIIRKCIETTLTAEGINIPCEINVLVTNDKGIRAINQASRGIDKPTDVLSFPMFQLDAGNPPTEWDEYMDPETDMCPLGDMAISFERAVELIQRDTRHFAKRQLTWFRHDPNIQWVDKADKSDAQIEAELVQIVRQKLGDI